MNGHRAIELAGGLIEHAIAGALRLVGGRYFDEAHFDRVYTRPDPWAYATSSYEAARREAVVAALPRPRYRSILEVGCGEGHTTRLLAERADRVVGLDISGSAIALARISGLPPNVVIAQGDLIGPALPPEAPPGRFDLVVCSEVLYYCYRVPVGPACRRARDGLVAWLEPGGDLLLEHPAQPATHRPFNRLTSLVAIERRHVALAPRPFEIAVYRRADGSSPRKGEINE